MEGGGPAVNIEPRDYSIYDLGCHFNSIKGDYNKQVFLVDETCGEIDAKEQDKIRDKAIFSIQTIEGKECLIIAGSSPEMNIFSREPKGK